MQIIGIYINSALPSVRKALDTGWYPFGEFSDCHKAIWMNDNFSKIQKEVEKNQFIVNRLYSKNSSLKLDAPKININTIIGKNGTGKSTLLDFMYAIINNFAVKLSSLYKFDEKTFSPIWAAGFDAELYFECNNKIAYIHSAKKTKESNKDYLY